jgi:alpha-1,2-mannosyltransferase
LVVTLVVSVLWAWIIYVLVKTFPPYSHHVILSDLGEHLTDSRALLSGRNPYVLRINLNDTTPPFTAILYTPFRLLHGTAQGIAATWVSMVALGMALATGLRRALRTRLDVPLLDWSVVSTVVLAPLTILVLSQASYSGIFWGQDQLFVLGLVAVDLFAVPSRHRGYLIGVATGILLTPVAFVLLVLVVAGWRGAFRSVTGFFATVLLAAAVNLHASVVYWFHLLPSGEAMRRVFILGSYHDTVSYAGNESLEAMLARHPFVHRVPLTPTWVLVAVVVGGLTVLVAWRAQRAGEAVTAATMLGLGVTAISPVAWDHHWVWAVELPVMGLELLWTRRVVAVAAFAAVPVAFLNAYPLTNYVPWPPVVATIVMADGTSVTYVVLLLIAVLSLRPRRREAVLT